MSTKLLAVYGTLRRGQGNYNYFLKDVPMYAHGEYLMGFRMSTFGGFPAIFRSREEKAVVVDIFNMEGTDPELLDRIDSMEFGVGYKREVVSTSNGFEVMVYVMPDDQADFFPEDIPSGNWNDYDDARYA